MTDSGAFTSLSDLVNSHLSKTEVVKSSPTTNSLNGIIGSSRHDKRTGADTSKATFAIPGLDFKTPTDFGNISSAVESSRRESSHVKIEDPEDCEDIIDLMKCLTTASELPQKPRKVSESSDEIEFKLSFDVDDEDISEPAASVKVTSYKKLRCVLDEYSNPVQTTCRGGVKKPKCSSIGLAICTRYVEVPEPYWNDEIVSSISRFKFNAKSPDDVVKDTIKKPRTNSGNFVKNS